MSHESYAMRKQYSKIRFLNINKDQQTFNIPSKPYNLEKNLEKLVYKLTNFELFN